MQNTDPSPIVGVFRDHAKAEHAVDELKQAGFRDDQIASSLYSLAPTKEEQTPENSRVVVTVTAEGRDQQVFGILFNNGANNGDLPPGMILRDGKLVESQAETIDLIPEPVLEADFPEDSYFGEVKAPGVSDEPIMGDSH